MAIEIVDLAIENGGSFHSYVKLPEGNPLEPLIFSPYRPLLSQTCVDKNPTKSMVFEVFCSTGRGKMEDWLIIGGRWVKHLAPQQRTVSWFISKTLAPKQNIALDKCSDAQTLQHVDHSWWTSKDIKHLQKKICGTLTVIYIYINVLHLPSFHKLWPILAPWPWQHPPFAGHKRWRLGCVGPIPGKLQKNPKRNGDFKEFTNEQLDFDIIWHDYEYD